MIVKFLKSALLIFFIFILTVTAALYFTDNIYLVRAFMLTYWKGHAQVYIYDYEDFDNRIVQTANPRSLELHEKYNKIGLTQEFKKAQDEYDSVAFLVLKDGKLLQENYFLNHNQKHLSNGFSMAKTVITMMVFKAINDGYIKSFDQPITDFLPEYKDDPYGKLATIADLSGMQSGYKWEQKTILPINSSTKVYYGYDIEKQALSHAFSAPPGQNFAYSSGATQLLSIILQRAIGMSLSDYLSQQFWQPLQMESDAYWELDGDSKMEKTYCCISATARDFARLGQLMLNEGRWGDKQILTPAQVKKMSAPNLAAFANKERANYGFSLWLDKQYQPNFYAFIGYLGQYIVVIPSENMVVVRLGYRANTEPREGVILSDTDTYNLVEQALLINSHLK